MSRQFGWEDKVALETYLNCAAQAFHTLADDMLNMRTDLKPDIIEHPAGFAMNMNLERHAHGWRKLAERTIRLAAVPCAYDKLPATALSSRLLQRRLQTRTYIHDRVQLMPRTDGSTTLLHETERELRTVSDSLDVGSMVPLETVSTIMSTNAIEKPYHSSFEQLVNDFRNGVAYTYETRAAAARKRAGVDMEGILRKNHGLNPPQPF